MTPGDFRSVALTQPMWFTGDGETVQELDYGTEKPVPKQGMICIDTGCGKGGWLTAMIIEDERFRLERS